MNYSTGEHHATAVGSLALPCGHTLKGHLRTQLLTTHSHPHHTHPWLPYSHKHPHFMALSFLSQTKTHTYTQISPGTHSVAWQLPTSHSHQ